MAQSNLHVSTYKLQSNIAYCCGVMNPNFHSQIKLMTIHMKPKYFGK